VHSIQPKKNTKRLAAIALAVIVCAGLVAAVNFARNWIEYRKSRALVNPVPVSPMAIAAGKHLYEDHCQKCHGSNGDGKGPKAAELSSSPGDFTNASEMNRRTDGELFWSITKGRSQMPAFNDKISEEGRWQLVNYIRTFEPKR
jgi:mono/diheme cytochrome c family protein